jgi:hypothetical protein
MEREGMESGVGCVGDGTYQKIAHIFKSLNINCIWIVNMKAIGTFK